MPDSPTITPTDYSTSPENNAFTLAEQGTLEIIELMGAADRLKAANFKDQTISLYRLWLEHTKSPLVYIGYFNLGVELASERDYIQAEAMYRKALELSPDFTRARLNLGNCLEQQKREDEALEEWRTALKSESILLPENQPLRLHALNNLGRLLEIKKNYKDSLNKLEESFSVDPTQRDVLLHLVHLVQKICRWPVYAPPKGITKQEMINGTSPLAMLAASDDPKLQLAAAQQFVEHKYPVTSSESLAPKGGYKHEKIRIGYLSSDFCLHAVSLLMVELLELHDHNKFEVYGFCWSRVDDTSIQRRVQKSMDHYIRIGDMSDKEAADCIRSHEIDIMVDLQGLTSGARPMILSYRPALLQMTYLGFPGTTGLPWIDYVIADKYLIPEELVPFHTEKPLYMPSCFQSSDSKREVGPMPTRTDNGLPEKAFVFCSFNNNYKFTPEIFAAWMRILKRVPGSVFWLLADNEWSKENLLKTAKKMGIKKEQLIFASRVAPADYLARYQLADLFLDTFPFNGGTTANDALFMGLPLLTLSGRTFASRMAGSLLTNLGLSALIATNLKEYEEKAVRFATNKESLKELRVMLTGNRNSGSVFDTGLFVKNYESSLKEVLKLTVAQHDSIEVISHKRLGRVLYVSPDSNKPTGGIKVIYKHAELLCKLGNDAHVMHFQEGFRCDWFYNSASVVTIKDILPTDMMIVPEIMTILGNQLHSIGIKYCMYVQNGYLVLPTAAMNEIWSCYNNATAIISISDDTTNYLKSIFPEFSDKIVRVKYSVDVSKFYSDNKINKVTFMPRKNVHHSMNVVPWLKKLFPEWVFTPLQDMSEDQVAEHLRSSKIFLAFSDFEGCPVPPIEAALSGNVVLGYHGWGGKEYWAEPNFRDVDFGDIRDFVRKFYEVASFANNLLIQQLLEPGINTLRVNYGYAAEREMLAHCIKFIESKL